MTEQNEKILGCYLRVSTQGQVDHGYSLGAQKEAAIVKGKQLEMKCEFYVDEGLSAKYDDIENRPALKSLLLDCADKKIHAVFCTEQDRLSRSLQAMGQIKLTLVQNNILFHTISGVTNFKDAQQEFMSDLFSLMAKQENSLKSIRSKRGLEAAARIGKWIGVVLPYGYRLNENKIMEIDPEEAEIVKMIFDWSLDGMGSMSIANKLNELGTPTRCRTAYKTGTNVTCKHTGKTRRVNKESFTFKPGTVFGILSNPIYKGERRYKEHIIPSPVIIEPEKWTKVRENMKMNKHYSVNNGVHFYLLKGLLRCGKCGRNLYGRYKPESPSKDNYYICLSKRERSCSLRSPNITRLDNLVWDQIINSDEHLQYKLSNEVKISDEAKIKLDRQLYFYKKSKSELDEGNSRIHKLYVQGKINDKQLDEMLAEHSAELKEVSECIDRIENREFRAEVMNDSIRNHINTISSVKQYLVDLSPEEKKKVVDEIVEHVVVDWDEERREHLVEVHYKINKIEYKAQTVIDPPIVTRVIKTWARQVFLRRKHHFFVTVPRR